jgi:O-antigen ligase
MKGLFFTYAVTFGSAALAPFYPYYAFLAYVAFANLKPEFLWPWSVPQGNYSRIVAVAFLFGWLLNGAGSSRLRPVLPIVAALVCYWAWLFLEATISPAQAEAWYAFEVLSKVFLPLIAGLTLLNSLERLKQLAWVLVLAHGMLAIQFNQQYYTYGIDSDTWMFAGLDNNSIAITMVTAVGLAFFLALASSVWWQRLTAFVLAALMAHVVLFSMSRGGMLAMCVSGGTAFLLMPKRILSYVALAVALVLVVSLAGDGVRKEFLSSFKPKEERDASAESRFQLTRDAFDRMLKEPLLGCGMENWGNIAPEYGWPRGKRAHNTWAEIGATLGVPGLAFLLAFYGLCAWPMFRISIARSPHIDPWCTWMARGVVAALAGFFASAWFVTVDRIELPYYIVLLGAGMLKVLAAERQKLSRETARDLLGATDPHLPPPLAHPEPA